MHRFEGLVSTNLFSLVAAEAGKFKLLVALSGGADSVALLCALKAIAASSDGLCEVYACHVNHGLRGAEADHDQSFCEQLCRSKGIALEVVKLDALKVDSSEESLRDLRYQALADAALRLSISHVVTAHTLTDQIETMLFRLCRGTALPGLTGIRAVRPLGSLLLLRPLLQVDRHAVEAYLCHIEQPWCSDISNLADRYSRNFLRNQIIPLLNQRFLGLSENLERLRLNLERENDLLDSLAAEQLERLRLPSRYGQFIAVEPWKKLHLALRARVVAALMRESGVEVSFERVERVLQLAGDSAGEGKRYSLGDGMDIVLEGGGLAFSGSAQIEASKNSKDEAIRALRDAMPAVAVRLPVEGSTTLTIIPWLDKALKVEALSRLTSGSSATLAFPHRQAHHCLMDFSSVVGSLLFRLRQEGDHIQPLGMSQPVRLKHYLHANKDADLSPGLLKHLDEPMARRLTPVLVDEKEVLWVPGFGLSQKVKVSQGATHRLTLIDLVHDTGKNDSSLC